MGVKTDAIETLRNMEQIAKNDMIQHVGYVSDELLRAGRILGVAEDSLGNAA